MKTQNTVFGRSRGTLGGVVASKWKDLNVVRSKPESVANPRTQGQLNARNKFKAVVDLSRQMKAVILIGFANFKSTMTEFNGFMKTNISTAFGIDVSNSVTFDPAELSISEGANGTTAVDWDITTNNLVLTYPNTPNLSLGQKSTDVLCYAVIDGGGVHIASGVVSNETRASSPATIMSTTGLATGTYNLYTFFANADLAGCEESVWTEFEV